MAAEHGSFPAFGGADLSPRLGIAGRNPFSLPPQPSPFVAHFYPMVNSARTIPPLLSPPDSLPSPNPNSLLASVAARRTDLLYTEFYRNWLKTAAAKAQGLQTQGIGSSSSAQGVPVHKEKSPHQANKFINYGSLENSTAHLRNFYEGLYNRFPTSDLYPRQGSQRDFRGTHDYPGRKDLTNQQQATNFSLRNLQNFGSSFQPSAFGRLASKISRDSNGLLQSSPEKMSEQGISPAESALKPQQKYNKILSNNEVREKNISPLSTKFFSTRSARKSVSSSDGIQNSDTEIRENAFKNSGDTNNENINRISPSSDTSIASDRVKRKRKLTSTTETCPVCGVTVRDTEIKQHLEHEISKLGKISCEVYRNHKKAMYKSMAVARKSFGLHQTFDLSITATTSKTQETKETESSSKENRFRTFQKVRGNRLDRFNSRVGQCRPPHWRGGSIPHGSWLDYNRNVNLQSNEKVNCEGVICPVCNSSLSHLSTHDQITDHVMQCAGGRPSGSDVKDDHEMVDVEADDGVFEEYEWCGETRVRATALVHRDLLASTPGFHIMQNADNDSDQDLNVDTDETGVFGGIQFTDGDLVSSNCSDEEGTSSQNQTSVESAQQERAGIYSSAHSAISPSNMISLYGNPESRSPSLVVQALRLKIQELENNNKDNRCLICMESYSDPLVSIQCWHVHCEKCWMRALGVKKLCPQCNMITPASHLRKIYL